MPFIGIPDREQNLIEKISTAIERRNLVKFWYENTTNDRKAWRTVEPYMVGSSANGKIGLLGWYLSDDVEDGWRLFNLKAVSQFEILHDEKFEIRESFDPDDQRMKTVYCSIELSS